MSSATPYDMSATSRTATAMSHGRDGHALRRRATYAPRMVAPPTTATTPPDAPAQLTDVQDRRAQQQYDSCCEYWSDEGGLPGLPTAGLSRY